MVKVKENKDKLKKTIFFYLIVANIWINGVLLIEDRALILMSLFVSTGINDQDQFVGIGAT